MESLQFAQVLADLSDLQNTVCRPPHDVVPGLALTTPAFPGTHQIQKRESKITNLPIHRIQQQPEPSSHRRPGLHPHLHHPRAAPPPQTPPQYISVANSHLPSPEPPRREARRRLPRLLEERARVRRAVAQGHRMRIWSGAILWMCVLPILCLGCNKG